MISRSGDVATAVSPSNDRLGYSRVENDRTVTISFAGGRENRRPALQVRDDRGCAREGRIGDADAAALEAAGRRQRLLRRVMIVLRRVMIVAVMVAGVRMRPSGCGFIAAGNGEPPRAASDERKRQQDCEERSDPLTHGCDDRRLPAVFSNSQGWKCTIYAQCCLFTASTHAADIALLLALTEVNSKREVLG
jgi:hypothetical protein